MISTMIRPWALLLTVVAAVVSNSHARAYGDYRTEDKAVVEANEVVDDDLYLFGDEITIDGEIKGDLVAFGRVIKMNGTVEGDFIAAGQAIVISGTVKDDARLAAQVLQITEFGSIEDDLIAAAFSIELKDDSTVDGDLVVTGFQALLGGDVRGDVKGGFSNCEIDGRVGGDVKLSIEASQGNAQSFSGGSPLPVEMPLIPPGLTIRENAKIDGSLKYTSITDADIADAATIIGEIEHEKPEQRVAKGPTIVDRVMGVVGRFVTLLVVGLFLLLLAPSWADGLATNLTSRPLASFGFGTAGMCGFGLLLVLIVSGTIGLAILAGFLKLSSLLAAIIVLGISIVLMLIVGFWFFTSYLVYAVAGGVAGRWFFKIAVPPLAESRYLAMIVGIGAIVLLTSIPYIGTLIGWCVVLFGLGAFILRLFKRGDSQAPPMSPEKPMKAMV